MRIWVEPEETPVSEELRELVGGSEIAAQALNRGGLSNPAKARAFLDPDVYFSQENGELPGLEQAAERLNAALSLGEGILVWGDFDVDGQTSTAVLVETLNDLGGQVNWHIPVRAAKSHGIGVEVLKKYLEAAENRPKLVVTCDTGITAFEAVEYARTRDVDVIITDHHELPTGMENGIGGEDAILDKQLPPAAAIVTPRFLPDEHPLADLPGVGTAYKLAQRLYADAGRSEEACKHLDLAALGIVADVAKLRGESRALLQKGLELLRMPEQVGIKAIYERAEIKPEQLNEEQIGFLIAPRLNAMGRLSDANPAVELFTTRDVPRARLIALELESLNIQRQLLTNQIFRAASSRIEQDAALREAPVIVLDHPAWAAGVIGIVASRLVEIYGRPAVLICSPPGQIGRGSARSIEGIDITAAIRTQRDILIGYGGHTMAAGFSIDPSNISQFRAGMVRAIASQLESVPQKKNELPIECYLKWEELDLDTAKSIEKLAPFGNGNPQPVMASKGLHLSSHNSLGRNKEHIQMTVEDERGNSRRVIWWGGAELVENESLPSSRFDLAYRLRTTSYRGVPELSIIFEDLRIESEISVFNTLNNPPEFVDLRTAQYPFQELVKILEENPSQDVQIWAESNTRRMLLEAFEKAKITTSMDFLHGRDELKESEILIVWSIPPGMEEFKTVMRQAKPSKVMVFGINPGVDQPKVFLERLAGLIKFIIGSGEKKIDLNKLASATAQTLGTTKAGIGWLQEKGYITLQSEGSLMSLDLEGDNPIMIKITNQGTENSEAASQLYQEISKRLRETQAFRKFFMRLSLETMAVSFQQPL